jgi:hypothetical protein
MLLIWELIKVVLTGECWCDITNMGVLVELY